MDTFSNEILKLLLAWVENRIFRELPGDVADDGIGLVIET